MNDDLEVLEAELGPSLRRTLDAAASARMPRAARPRRRRHRRTLAGGAAGVLAVVGFAAWNGPDPGEIERIPVETALMSGDATGGRWWLLPSVHERCGRPAPGVEFVAAATNKPGTEWNTGGVEYGEPSSSDALCDQWPDEGAWLGDPTIASFGYMKIGHEKPQNDWGFQGAFHPGVHQLSVRVDDGASFVVATVPLPDRPDGPRYAAFDVPASARRVVTTFLDARSMPIEGSERVTELPLDE